MLWFLKSLFLLLSSLLEEKSSWPFLRLRKKGLKCVMVVASNSPPLYQVSLSVGTDAHLPSGRYWVNVPLEPLMLSQVWRKGTRWEMAIPLLGASPKEAIWGRGTLNKMLGQGLDDVRGRGPSQTCNTSMMNMQEWRLWRSSNSRESAFGCLPPQIEPRVSLVKNLRSRESQPSGACNIPLGPSMGRPWPLRSLLQPSSRREV